MFSLGVSEISSDTLLEHTFGLYIVNIHKYCIDLSNNNIFSL